MSTASEHSIDMQLECLIYRYEVFIKIIKNIGSNTVLKEMNDDLADEATIVFGDVKTKRQEHQVKHIKELAKELRELIR